MTKHANTPTNHIDNKSHARQHIDYLEEFLILESKLQCISEPNKNPRKDEETDLIVKQQIEIINECASAEACLIQDTLYKLEIWRAWQRKDLSFDPDCSNKLVHSVLNDMRTFFGEIRKGGF